MGRRTLDHWGKVLFVLSRLITRRSRRTIAAAAAVGVMATPLAVLAATSPAHAATPVEIQILGTNDFHGRLQNNTSNTEAGAAVLAGAVKQLRGQNPNTVFTAAGDLIGASTFESFILKDKPTIDSLNEAGLEVSAAGNHEFDRGYDDLLKRVMAPYDAQDNPYGGAEWEYIAANVEKPGAPADEQLAKSWTKEMDGVKVGFVGAVTEHLPELVAPGGMEGVETTDIVEAVNDEADALKADGADLVIMLVHEGAPSTKCAAMDDDPSSDFGSIVTGVNPNVDAIVSGHTHLAYNCSFPVDEWGDREVQQRPVVSAGQYGMALNQLTFSVDPDTGKVTDLSQRLLRLKSDATTFNYPADPDTAAIVAQAVSDAEAPGSEVLGKIDSGLYRAKLANNSTENRGGESTLGNMVAEAQRWQTDADIAFMNPGGLRADMTGNAGDFPRDLTYKQAAGVQPFANTLTTMTLTGAEIETALEEQWQAAGASRPFLRLGASAGFTYTYEPVPDGAPAGTKGEITGMWLNGEPIADADTFKVSVNSFLSTGGDGFATFAGGTNRADSGKTDLEGMVDYMAQYQGDALAVDYSQRAVGVTMPDDAPESYGPGDQVAFDVSSWSMTNPLDTKDTAIDVKLGDQTLGTATLDNTVQAALPGFDTTGTASVDVTLPDSLPTGAEIHLVGAQTGTEVVVPIETGKLTATLKVTKKPAKVVVKKTKVKVAVAVNAPAGQAQATGKVTIKAGGKTYNAQLKNGKVTITLNPFKKVGQQQVKVSYAGDAQYDKAAKTIKVKVVKK